MEGRRAAYVINLYGWTNGHSCELAAQRTNSLVIAAMGEFVHLPPLPRVMCCDLNANTTDVPAILDLLNNGWIAVGAHADIWGGTPCAPTCQAPNNKWPPTRRDFVFADAAFVTYIQDFNVFWTETYAVYTAVLVLLKTAEPKVVVHKNIKPANLSEAIKDRIAKIADSMGGQNPTEDHKRCKARNHISNSRGHGQSHCKASQRVALCGGHMGHKNLMEAQRENHRTRNCGWH